MSERWASEKPNEIRVTTSHDFDDYLKCIQLMYGESVYITNVKECLAILSVASELLADECINECMQYLEAVRWSSEQESQIRDVLSSLAIGDRKIIISRASRISFLTTWLPIMGKLCCGRVGKPDELDKAVLKVVESLPLVDKVSICVQWIELYNQYSIDIATPLTLFTDLQDAPYKSTSKQ
ncbi:hypothetical protein SUGI_1013250 [Cryptomeria japonica]|nr:hypothetical protein SUGI_1013250 [Cryptomeria japonica]